MHGQCSEGWGEYAWARREYLRVSARVPVLLLAAMSRGPALFGVKVDHTHRHGHVLLFIARMAGRAGGLLSINFHFDPEHWQSIPSGVGVGWGLVAFGLYCAPVCVCNVLASR